MISCHVRPLFAEGSFVQHKQAEFEFRQTFPEPRVYCMYRQFNIQQFYVLPTQCI